MTRVSSSTPRIAVFVIGNNRSSASPSPYLSDAIVSGLSAFDNILHEVIEVIRSEPIFCVAIDFDIDPTVGGDESGHSSHGTASERIVNVIDGVVEFTFAIVVRVEAPTVVTVLIVSPVVSAALLPFESKISDLDANYAYVGG